MADKTTVLVLGSTGMLGIKIVKALLEKDEAEDSSSAISFAVGIYTYLLFA